MGEPPICLSILKALASSTSFSLLVDIELAEPSFVPSSAGTITSSILLLVGLSIERVIYLEEDFRFLVVNNSRPCKKG